jgi:hypothetical protein
MAKNTRTLSKNPGRTIRRIASAASAWENLASGETFAGMTLSEFKQAIEPSFAARERNQGVCPGGGVCPVRSKGYRFMVFAGW